LPSTLSSAFNRAFTALISPVSAGMRYPHLTAVTAEALARALSR
jgi:hypothetical protein